MYISTEMQFDKTLVKIKLSGYYGRSVDMIMGSIWRLSEPKVGGSILFELSLRTKKFNL